MRDSVVVLITLLACLAMSARAGRSADLAHGVRSRLTLVKDGRSDYRIVVPAAASEHEQLAAQELRSVLRQMSGAILPIVSDDVAATDKEIIVGRSSRLGEMGVRIGWKKLGGDGFTIRTVGSRLVIAGGSERGSIYGVCAFLEEHLGCRWYTPTVSVVPGMATIEIGAIRDTQVPAFEYRDVHYAEAKDVAFRRHQRLNGGVYTDRPNGKVEGVVPGFGGWAHTFFTLLPPEKYFESHPEYYALRGGRRVATQPCLSNPDVLRIMVDNLRTYMASDPTQLYWSVSQQDNADPCECEQCKALDEREGSAMASVLNFVNKVAAQFPDKRISTLAYWYTMKPPKTIRPAKNVHIMYCIGNKHALPIATDPVLAEYCRGFRIWGQEARHMYVWYYGASFDVLIPFPNLHSLGPDLAFFRENGATGVFVEGLYTAHNEMAELRTYLLAKLLWNPDRDTDALIDDFLRGYFGPAAPAIRRYLDTAEAAAVASDKELAAKGSYTFPAGHFTPELFARYDACFDEAERAVADDPELLQRVQIARLAVINAQLRHRYGSVDNRIAAAKYLLEAARRWGPAFLEDFDRVPLEPYIEGILAELQREKLGQ